MGFITDDIYQLSLDDISQERSDALLSLFLRASINSGSGKCCSSVLDLFDDKRCKVDRIPSVLRAFTSGIDIDAFLRVLGRQNISYYVDLINCNEDMALSITEKIIQFVRLNRDEWAIVRDLLEDCSGDTRVCTLLELESYKPHHEPGWITRVKTRNVSHPVVTSVDNGTREMISRSVSIGVELNDDLIENLERHYRMSTPLEKMTLSNGDTDGIDDISHFRVHGPVNTSTIDGSDVHCAMFDCKCHLRGSDDWFTGTCDSCSEKIVDKRYAIRKPEIRGGWSGCYDAFECIPLADRTDAIFVSRLKQQLYRINISI